MRYAPIPHFPSVLFVFFLIVLAPCIQAAEPPLGVFDFEAGLGHNPNQWSSGQLDIAGPDSLTVHSGNLSARIKRPADCSEPFNALSFRIPSDRDGKIIELRGWLKSENVTESFGLWFRQDGNSGNVGFKNMQNLELKGTTDWTEYSLTLPLSPHAHTLVIGALSSGSGTIWADDFVLFIDDRPFAEAPLKKIDLTVLNTDIGFVSGSEISFLKLSDIQVDNLALLGKVWGFLKYHHPAVTGGQYHWDFELFRVLPRILQAADREKAHQELTTWIDDLGPLDPCDPCAEAATNPAQASNTDWLDDHTLLGQDLSAALTAVYSARPVSEDNFWVGFKPMVGNPVFDRELAYNKINKNDAGYKLLALFRFWNIVEYCSPNRDIIGENWSDVLHEFVAPIALSADLKEYNLAMLRLVARVHDTHTQLYGAMDIRPPTSIATVPVEVRWIEEQPVISGWTLEPQGPETLLQIGDVISMVDGEDVGVLMKEWAPYYSASNDPKRNSSLAQALVRGPMESTQLTILREGKTIDLTVQRVFSLALDKNRHRFHTLTGEPYKILPSGIAYLALEGIKRDMISASIEDAIAQDAKGLIIDCRSYPSDFPIFQLGGHLVSEPTPFVSFSRADQANPGTFLWHDGRPLTPIAPHFSRPVVILVDEISQSSAEYHALAFRAAPQSVVMGSTTAGADGNISRFPLPGGLKTLISGIGVYDANHGNTQGVGIVPDFVVEPTIAGIREGRDEVLEAAVANILER